MALLDFLSTAARRALPLIRRGVRENMPSRAMQRALRAQGYPVRRQELLRAMRAIKGIQDTGPRLSSMRMDRFPNPANLPSALGPIRRNYGFVVEHRGSNPFTGVTESRFITVSSDDLMTRGDIEAWAKEVVEEEPDRYKLENAHFIIREGYKQGASGALL